MMNDTVREELQTKITSGNLPRIDRSRPVERVPEMPPPPRPALLTPPPPVPRKKHVTAELAAPKTSPTLVEFQNKNTSVPDWRLQLQNAVQQRKGGQGSASRQEHSYPTNGGAALKAEVVPPIPPVAAEPVISDPRVANAMRRIDQSRKVFSSEHAVKRPSPPKVAPRAFPFDVVQNSPRPASPSHVRPPAIENAQPKPKLVVPPPAAELKRDTNKLPPLPSVPATIERVELTPASEPSKLEVTGHTAAEFTEIKRIQIKAEPVEPEEDTIDVYDEIDDLAPFAMRFGAGLFDLIIGAFMSMIIIAPFALNGADWFTASGAMIAAGTWAVVMFVYMTASLGFAGKTMGMRLFSLELVDAVENEYPTLQQAAISSSVFLLSLIFAGAGFVTVLFNEEKRAVHDLLSGTILVRDF